MARRGCMVTQHNYGYDWRFKEIEHPLHTRMPPRLGIVGVTDLLKPRDKKQSEKAEAQREVIRRHIQRSMMKRAHVRDVVYLVTRKQFLLS